jgi:hypothetical protein
MNLVMGTKPVVRKVERYTDKGDLLCSNWEVLFQGRYYALPTKEEAFDFAKELTTFRDPE